LRNDKHVGSERALKHNRHVGSIEELDGITSTLSSEPVALHRDLNPESLEIDHNCEDDNGCKEVHDVGQSVPPERFTKGTAFVVPSEQQMEQRDDGAFEFGSTADVDCGWRESFPDDGFTNVGGNEERDTRTETVTLLEELVKEDDDECGGYELDDKEETDASAEVFGLTV